MTEAAEKKNVQKLQRVIVDALEDVKASNVAVFNTEHISSLFERVIIASGTSNRQTKALAANVRDQVRKHGFSKPRIEGEENGEWIIVDCGAAVAHIMQPNIREYYNLEEIWGEKPVRLKFGAPKPPVVEPKAPEKKSTKTGAKTSKGTKASASSGKAPAKKAASSVSAKSKAPAKSATQAPVKKAASKTASAKSGAAKATPSPKSKPKSASAGAKTSTPARKRSTPKA